MNTLRSTERRLTLIGFQRKAARATTTRTSHRPYHRKAYNHPAASIFRTQGKINLLVEQRQLATVTATATTQLKNVPLLNPDKMEPKDLKEVSLEPIVRPLTCPRFPKDKLDIPSVTKVLQATMPAASKFILDRWKEAMIRQLGVAGFNKYQLETFERGRLLHALLEKYLISKIEPSSGQAELSKEIVQNLWKSIEKVVHEKIKDVRLVEHIVTHPTMNYRGIVDCVASYEDELVVIDFKTAEKPKKTMESLYDNPLQVTAYCGAINCDTKIHPSVIDRNICAGLVIIAYVDGSEASVHRLGRDAVLDYWKQWTARLDQYIGIKVYNQQQ